MDAAEDLIQSRKAKEVELFRNFDSYVKNNEESILILLARHEAKEKLFDFIEIDMLKCLKKFIQEYEDLKKAYQFHLGIKFKGNMFTYIGLKLIIDDIKVASKEERISKLKADLEVKKAELEKVSGKVKGLVEKEITTLKLAIADLV